MSSKIVTDCAAAIAQNGLNIAFIESATAGRMCSEFALTEFSGDILRGGLASYEVFVKEQILHVPRRLIDLYTPESPEVTAAMATGGDKLFNADITVAVTGLTTPGGSETAEKPVGTMFLHVLYKGQGIAQRDLFKGDPESIILQTVDSAAALIIRAIKLMK